MTMLRNRVDIRHSTGDYRSVMREIAVLPAAFYKHTMFAVVHVSHVSHSSQFVPASGGPAPIKACPRCQNMLCAVTVLTPLHHLMG
jgi:hypothetical protein